jgi:hypothetical protein
VRARRDGGRDVPFVYVPPLLPGRQTASESVGGRPGCICSETTAFIYTRIFHENKQLLLLDRILRMTQPCIAFFYRGQGCKIWMLFTLILELIFHPSAEFLMRRICEPDPPTQITLQNIAAQNHLKTTRCLNIYLYSCNLKLRGGDGDSDDLNMKYPLESTKKKKKKTTIADKFNFESWRKLKPGDPLPDGLEIRKMTREGNHILRVGETFSKRGIKLREGEAKRLRREKMGLKQREKAIQELEQMIKEQKTSGMLSSGNLPSKPVKELEKDLQELRNDLIRYKDAIHGTDVWKQMTAHTVPHSLRHVDQFKTGDDLLLYKSLAETRSIVFNHHKASSAAPEVFQTLSYS